MKHHKVTRVEVIDQTGRAYVNMNAGEVEIMLQDDDRTLKVFTKGGKERMFTESEVRAAAMAAIEAMKADFPHSPGHLGRAAGAIGKAMLDIGIILDPA